MRIRHFPVAVGILAIAIVAGCTTPRQGEPTAATTADTTTSADPTEQSSDNGSELPFAGAPKVEKPLDTTRFQQDPCQALTSDQIAELNLPPTGRPRDAPLGKACTWTNFENRAEAEVHFQNGDPRGLSALYQANENDKYAYFEPVPTIEGFPAVALDVVEDRYAGRCTVVVGVSDEITFAVPIRLSSVNVGKREPCEAAVEVAGMALQTMKKG